MHSKRYNRQTELPEIGILGQEKLTNAKVLIIGAGGLGCPVLQNLVAAGVGHIGIMDGDVVEETNLHRQFLYTLADCGKNKATIATDAVFKQNPEIKVIPYSFHFAKKNAFEIISDYQIIVDCTDDIATRYLINDVSLARKYQWFILPSINLKDNFPCLITNLVQHIAVYFQKTKKKICRQTVPILGFWGFCQIH